MSSRKKHPHGIDPVQRELIEKAQSRARQKRRLYVHFIFFLIISVVVILLQMVFNVGVNYRPLGMDWFVWVIILLAIFLFLHAFNVFITNKFLGKEWENDQVDRLVRKQQKRIDELRAKVEKEYPIPSKKELRNETDPNKPGPTPPTTNPDDPIHPFNT